MKVMWYHKLYIMGNLWWATIWHDLHYLHYSSRPRYRLKIFAFIWMKPPPNWETKTQSKKTKRRAQPLLTWFLPVLFQLNPLNTEKSFLELRSCLIWKVALSAMPKLPVKVTFFTEIAASQLITSQHHDQIQQRRCWKAAMVGDLGWA